MNIKAVEAPKILSFLTLFVLTIHTVVPGTFGAIDVFAYFVAFLYLLLFSVAFYAYLFYFSNHSPKNNNVNYIYFLPSSKTRFIFLLFICFFLYLYFFNIGFNYSSFIEWRVNLIQLFRTSEFDLSFKILNVIGLISFFFATYLYLFDDRYGWAYTFAALTFPLLMANRNFILVFFIYVFYKLIIIQNKYRIAIVFLSIFLMLNMLYVYAFDKGDDELNILFSTIKSITQYVATPLHGFTHSLDNPVNYGYFLTLPSSLVEWMGYEVNRDYQYTSYPFQTNVYTLFFGLIYDFSIFGVAGFAILAGGVHAYLFNKAKTNDLFVFVYLYSLYPLLMVFFDNAYTTSLGVWFYIFVPFIFFDKISVRNLPFTLRSSKLQ